MNALTSLANAELVDRFEELGRIRRTTLIQTVSSLAEICRRRIHLNAGCQTLAEFCRVKHGEERSKAWRIGLAAEAVAKFALAEELLVSRQLSVTALVAIKYALDLENHEQLLRAAVGLTEEEAAILASQFKPKPPRTDSIRPVSVFLPAFVEPAASSSPPGTPGEHGKAAPAPARRVELVVEQRFEIFALVTPEVNAQFEAVKAALSHKVPNGNINDILAECFRVTLDVCERRKIGAPPRSPLSLSSGEPASARDHSRIEATVVEAPFTPAEPRVATKPQEADLSNGLPPPAPMSASDFAAFEAGLDDRSRKIPVTVRRPVWFRDGGRCPFTGPDGHRCNTRYQLEFDHWRAFSLGGEHTVENVRILCSAHNRYEAERVLGKKLMRKYFR